MADETIERNFTYHKPEGDRIGRHEEIRAKGKEFAELIDGLCLPGRERSLAMTKLEEALLPARAGMIRPSTRRTRSSRTAPRTRGDDPNQRFYKSRTWRCSPHARG